MKHTLRRTVGGALTTLTGLAALLSGDDTVFRARPAPLPSMRISPVGETTRIFTVTSDPRRANVRASPWRSSSSTIASAPNASAIFARMSVE